MKDKVRLTRDEKSVTISVNSEDVTEEILGYLANVARYLSLRLTFYELEQQRFVFIYSGGFTSGRMANNALNILYRNLSGE